MNKHVYDAYILPLLPSPSRGVYSTLFFDGHKWFYTIAWLKRESFTSNGQVYEKKIKDGVGIAFNEGEDIRAALQQIALVMREKMQGKIKSHF